MNWRTFCICIMAIIAVLAIVLLWYATGPSFTGAVATHICPKGSTPIISGEDFLRELEDFQRRGYRCFFGFDSVTPCCTRS